MAGYDNTNTGSLFRNDKDGNEKRPDYRGSINCGGVEYWVSGWIREAGPNTKRAGEKFLSLALEAKEAKLDPPVAAAPKPAATKSGNSVADLEDDLPF